MICGSRKPAPGSKGRSAARELLRVVEARLRDFVGETTFIDLRDVDLPHFDGRTLEDYGSADLIRIRDAIVAADLIVFAIPAYWNGLAGPLKNLLDVLGGAAYDHPEPETAFTRKLTALLVVGADDASAHNAAAQSRVILTAMGAWVTPSQFVVGNLRQVSDPKSIINGLNRFADQLRGIVLPATV